MVRMSILIQYMRHTMCSNLMYFTWISERISSRSGCLFAGGCYFPIFSVYVCIRIYIYIYIHIQYVCMYVYIYIHIYIYIMMSAYFSALGSTAQSAFKSSRDSLVNHGSAASTEAAQLVAEDLYHCSKGTVCCG